MLIKTNYNGCPYITAGKEYKAYPQNGEWIGFHGFTADDGELAIISDVLKGCPHLDGHDWQVVQEEYFSQDVAQEMYELLESLRENYGMSSAVGKEIDELLAKARGE